MQLQTERAFNKILNTPALPKFLKKKKRKEKYFQASNVTSSFLSQSHVSNSNLVTVQLNENKTKPKILLHDSLNM